MSDGTRTYFYRAIGVGNAVMFAYDYATAPPLWPAVLHYVLAVGVFFSLVKLRELDLL